MIKDTPVKIIQWAIIAVEKYLLRHFSKVSYYDVPEISRSTATLVLMNHFSFNDGAILHRLCRRLIKKQFKVMVVEGQLKAFFPLKYVGCFSINKKSKSVVESLNYAALLLENPDNMLGIFPQGQVYSFHLNQIHFEKGLDRILNKVNKPIQVIFAVALLDYLDSFKPHGRVYLKEHQGENSSTELENAYNEFYRLCKINNAAYIIHHQTCSIPDKHKRCAFYII